MKRERILALVGGGLLAFAAAAGRNASPPEQTDWLSTSACSAPTTKFSASDSGMAVVLFHGLAANRPTMSHLARGLSFQDVAVITVDWPGHGDSTEPFSFAALDDCAEQLLAALSARGELRLERTVIVGHSTGAAAALRLADRLPVAATIAISPGVTALPRRMPSNLLVVTGEWDIPQLSRFAEKLAAAAGGARTAPEDFLQRRAFQRVVIPRATHASLLIDREALAVVARWAERAIPEARLSGGPTGASLHYWWLGMLGLLLVFPLGATIVAGATGARGAPEAVGGTPLGGTALRWAAAGLLAALALRYGMPLRFLRLYDGDWMASFTFLTGVVLLYLLWRRPERAAVIAPGGARGVRAVVAAATVAMATMLAFGWWLDGQLYDAWLNAPRWWRFAAAAPLLAPYLLAEEIALGAPTAEWRTEVRRYARFLLLRAVLAGLAAAACFTIGGALLAILLGPYIALGGIVVRLGADAIRRRTGSAAAAAVIGAILAAWALAAALPLL